MDNSQAPSSILETLRTVEFRLGLKGYNVDEVDEYLDKAAQEAEGLQEHVRQLNERLRQSSERITQLERERRAAPAAAEAGEEGVAATPDSVVLSDETLQRTLLLAQKFVDQTKRESEAEAAALVAHAEETAAAAIASAEATAAQLQAESQKQLREEVARLEATRTELATDVESMARHLDSERNRLTAALSDILKWVEDNVQPANSLMGVKAKGGKANGGDPGRLPETDDGAPTLNFQSVSGAAASGAPHSL
jgi:cell division initiation protein